MPGAWALISSDPKMWCRDHKLPLSRSRESPRQLQEVRRLDVCRRFDEPHPHVAAGKRLVGAVLELVDRLRRVPARGPEARDDGRWRLPLVPLHGEGERRLRIVQGLRLEHGLVSVHRRASAVALRLPGDLHARDPEGGGRGHRQKRGEHGQVSGDLGGELVDQPRVEQARRPGPRFTASGTERHAGRPLVVRAGNRRRPT